MPILPPSLDSDVCLAAVYNARIDRDFHPVGYIPAMLDMPSPLVKQAVYRFSHLVQSGAIGFFVIDTLRQLFQLFSVFGQ